MEYKYPDRNFISLVNRELKRLHEYLYLGPNFGDSESRKWAMDRITELHKSFYPIVFIPKDSGIEHDDL